MTSLSGRRIIRMVLTAMLGVGMWAISSSGHELQKDSVINQERRLYHDLMDDYEKFLRPVNHHDDTVEVKFSMSLRSIDYMDEDQHSLYVTAWIMIYWTDVQLIWDPEHFDGISSIQIPMTQLWKPDLPVRHSKGPISPLLSFDQVASIAPNGRVEYYESSQVKLNCKNDVTRFPYDTVSCQISIGSWLYSQQQVDLKFYGDENTTSDLSLILNANVLSDEFVLTNASSEVNSVTFDCCPESYVNLYYKLNFKRNPTFSTHLFLAPSVTLSLVIPTIFLVPVDSSERLTFGVGVLIAHTLLFGQLVQYVPAGHKYGLPIICKFFLINIVLISLSLACSSVIINLWSRGKKLSTGPPALLRMVFLNRVVTTILCIKPSRDDAENDDGKLSCETELTSNSDLSQITVEGVKTFHHPENRKPMLSGHWRTLAQVIDRLFTIAFFVTVVVACVMFTP